jgi:hypothetical protein
VTNRKPKATSSRVRQWDAGTPLSFARFACVSDEARREYEMCDIDSRRMSLRLDMQFRVHDDLISSKLVAWGFREGAPPEEGPTLIPAHLFQRDREDTAAVDWKTSTLRSSGHFFDRIRVKKPQRRTRQKKQTSGPTSKLAKLPRHRAQHEGQLQSSPRHQIRRAARGWMNRSGRLSDLWLKPVSSRTSHARCKSRLSEPPPVLRIPLCF